MSSLTRDELRQHYRQHLTGYKVPKDIEFRDELPKSNVGKILKTHTAWWRNSKTRNIN